MHIVFAVSSFGLGHSTRTLPLIKASLDEGNHVTIFSSGNAMSLLKQELGNKVDYKEIKDYDLGYKERGPSDRDIFLHFPFLVRDIAAEHVLFNKFSKKNRIDRIVADGKYGFHLDGVPSYFISNQLRFRYNKNGNVDGNLTELFNFVNLKNYTGIIIPDFEENSIGGMLDHKPNFIDRKKLHYIGIVSGVSKKKVRKDVDTFISISGPFESRANFEKKVLEQAPSLPGKVVVALGNPNSKKVKRIGNLVVYSYLNRAQQELMLNRAKMVVSRSGYTTLMELAEIGQKAFFIPIPRHFEQEYLAEYQKRLGNCHYSKQENFDLAKDLKTAKKYRGLNARQKTKQSIEKFKQIVLG